MLLLCLQFASMARQAGSIDVNNATALANQVWNKLGHLSAFHTRCCCR
jgi:hypothetical protein